jgi:hypothetical protein
MDYPAHFNKSDHLFNNFYSLKVLISETFTKSTCGNSRHFQFSLVKLLELMKASEQLSDVNFLLDDNLFVFFNLISSWP